MRTRTQRSLFDYYLWQDIKQFELDCIFDTIIIPNLITKAISITWGLEGHLILCVSLEPLETCWSLSQLTMYGGIHEQSLFACRIILLWIEHCYPIVDGSLPHILNSLDLLVLQWGSTGRS